MMYQLRLKPSAEKKLKRIPKRDRFRIFAAFAILTKTPFLGKKLKGEYQGQWSYRVWPYRIIYTIRRNELLILVLRVAHRQSAY